MVCSICPTRWPRCWGGIAGQWLYLDGLTTLSGVAAKALAGKDDQWLSLNGLTVLSQEVADGLAAHQGQLNVKGLDAASRARLDEARALRAKQAGR